MAANNFDQKNTCSSCRFSVMNVAANGLMDPNTRVCRRLPPTPVALPNPRGIEIKGFWPTMSLGDSCFSHERRMNVSDLATVNDVGLKAN